MPKITPFLWFDKNIKEITGFYMEVFSDAKPQQITELENTPSGHVEMDTMTILGQQISLMTAGPMFKFNPSISFFVVFDNEKQIDAVWNKLIEGGKALMQYNQYPWAKKYGWLQDKYGLSWQLSWSDNHNMVQRVTPLLMFTKEMAGKTKEAVEFYTSVFPNSKTEMLVPYEKGEGDKEGYIKHSRFILDGQNFMAMDSSGPHEFTFNEAFSFVVRCESQEEIDHYWAKLSFVSAAEQCGWLKDKFGVSWQIVPAIIDKMMASGDAAAIGRVTQAFLKMKKFDIKKLEEAFEGK